MKNLAMILCVLLASNLEASGFNRFPPPSFESVEKETEIITDLGKSEVLSLSYSKLTEFLWDTYVRGPGDDFDYGNCNPRKLTLRQAVLPATILLHANESNQGQWIPLIDAIKKYNKADHCCGPVFTYNFKQETDLIQLIDKIERVRELYLEAGQPYVEINLVGHSLGAICSAEYAFNPELWVEDTIVKKVISIAGRLKNIEPPIKTPHYPYCYDVLERIDNIWDSIQKNRGIVELFTIAAGDDWLVPQESVLVGDDPDHMAIIPGKGHVIISRSKATSEVVIKWLFN